MYFAVSLDVVDFRCTNGSWVQSSDVDSGLIAAAGGCSAVAYLCSGANSPLAVRRSLPYTIRQDVVAYMEAKGPRSRLVVEYEGTAIALGGEFPFPFMVAAQGSAATRALQEDTQVVTRAWCDP